MVSIVPGFSSKENQREIEKKEILVFLEGANFPTDKISILNSSCGF